MLLIVALQVREMVEIITREFIQMGGSAGEVRIQTNWLPFVSKWKNEASAFHPDGVGASQDSAEVHVDDESGVPARYL